MELEKEKYNGRSEEQGWYRHRETETFSKSNTSLELPEGSMSIYVEGGKSSV
jgi:hypothetical protein